jgi:hypothetical protein
MTTTSLAVLYLLALLTAVGVEFLLLCALVRQALPRPRLPRRWTVAAPRPAGVRGQRRAGGVAAVWERGPRGRTAAVLHETDAQAAIAEAIRILRAAQRPRCWRCRHLMDRDARSAFWHCTVAGCPGSLLATDSEPL